MVKNPGLVATEFGEAAKFTEETIAANSIMAVLKPEDLVKTVEFVLSRLHHVQEVTQGSGFEEEEEPEKYKLECIKRPGVENEGREYEVVMTALYALKFVLQENVSKVFIASNLDEYGVFDDTIIRVEYKRAKRPELYLVQLKNKMKDILSTKEFQRNGKFWLKKYKDSYYKNIKKKLRDADGFTEGISEDDIVMCLLTNASIEGHYMFPLETHLICSKFSHNYSKDLINTKSDGCYKFEIHKSCIERSQFLYELLQSNFCSEVTRSIYKDCPLWAESAELKEFICYFQSELTKKFEKGDDAYENIIERILDKLSKNKVTIMTSEKYQKVRVVSAYFRKELKAALTIFDSNSNDNMEYNNFVSELFKTDRNLIEREIRYSDREFFKNISTDLFSKLLSQYHNKISDSKAEGNRSKDLFLQNVFERMEKYLLFKYKLVKGAEYSAFYKRFFFYSGQVNVKEAENEIASLIEKAFGQGGPAITEQYLKYIKAHFKATRYSALTKRDIKMKLLELLTGLTDANQLKERYKVFENITDMCNYNQRIDVLREVKVSIQGRQEVNLAELASKCFHEKISATFLFKHLGQTIHVGLEENLKLDIYVKRKFFKILLSKDVLFNAVNNVFIFGGEKSRNSTHVTGSKKSSCYNHVNGNLQVDLEGRQLFDIVNDIKQQKDRDNAPIHYLKKHCGKCLEWQMSWNSIKDLGDFLVENDCVDEHEVLQYFSGGLNVISAAPGMGKSTILHVLANYCQPDVLVLKLDLNARYKDLRENNHLKSNSLNYLCSLMKSPSVEPEMKIFEDQVFQYCLEQNRLVVFIDVFDEVIAEDTVLETTFSIIEQLRDRKITVWLFTRPLALPLIQNKYKILAINMAGFTENDIKYYLSRKLPATEQARLNKFLTGNSLTLYSVPQYLKMLVSIYDQSITFENLKITDLYDRFVQMIFNKYLEVRQIDLQRKNLNKGVLYQDYSKIHKVAALCVIYGKRHLVENRIFSEAELNNILDKFSESENNFGMVVTVRDGSPVFFHKTYAEYWTALWLFDSYSVCINQVTCNCQHHGKHRSMYEYLFDSRFKNVRLMFDVLACQERNIHSAVLEDDFEKVKEELKKFSKEQYVDKFGRTPLHLAMGYISQNENDGITVSNNIVKHLAVYAKTNNCCLHQSDKLLGWNCYKYGKASGVKCLLHKISEWGTPEILKLTVQPSKRCFSKCNRKILSSIFTFERKNVKELLNETDLSMRKALHVASQFGNTSCVQYLIKLGADVNSRTRTESTPVHLAAKNGNVEVLKLLCTNGGKINVVDKNKYTPLHLASLHGHPDCVKYLIEMHSNTDSTTKLSVIIALRIAVEHGHINILELLFLKMGNFNVVYEDGQTLLHLATTAGQIESVRYLIHLQCNVNTKTKTGNTSMHLAASKGYCDVLQLLHENGGKFSETNSSGLTSLHEAIHKEHIDCVMYLIKAGADVNTASYGGLTPLHLVALKGSTNSLRYLIQLGANIDLRDHIGRTAMHSAALNGRADSLRLLIESGGDINLRDSEGYTVLHSASSSGRITCVQYLIDADFDVNNKTESEEKTTAMCLAAKEGYTGVLKILTEARGDISLVDSYGRTPLRLAIENGRTDCTRYLLGIGADANLDTETKQKLLHLTAREGYKYTHRLLTETWRDSIQKIPIG